MRSVRAPLTQRFTKMLLSVLPQSAFEYRDRKREGERDRFSVEEE